MPDSVEYTAFVATKTYTHQFTDSTRTKTYVLPPQTTPFTVGASGVDCKNRAIYCFMELHEVGDRPQTCSDWDFVKPFTYGMLPECYPEQYWDALWPHHYTYLGESTMAFPGTACLASWTSACERTLTLPDLSVQTQTWCCPGDGNWECYGGSPGQSRVCESMLDPTSQPVWLRSRNSNSNFERYETTINSAVLVRRPVFALGNVNTPQTGLDAAPAPTTTGTTGTSDRDRETPGAGNDHNNGSDAKADTGSSGLSTRTIVGITVGATLGFLIVLALLGSVAYGRWKKKKKKQQQAMAAEEAWKQRQQHQQQYQTTHHYQYDHEGSRRPSPANKSPNMQGPFVPPQQPVELPCNVRQPLPGDDA